MLEDLYSEASHKLAALQKELEEAQQDLRFYRAKYQDQLSYSVDIEMKANKLQEQLSRSKR